LVIIMGKIDGI